MTRAVTCCLTLLLGTALGAAACGADSASTTTDDLPPAARLGLEEAQHAGCASCHGPDFTGGVAPGAKRVQGATLQMPTVSLSDEQVGQIVDWLVAAGADPQS